MESLFQFLHQESSSGTKNRAYFLGNYVRNIIHIERTIILTHYIHYYKTTFWYIEMKEGQMKDKDEGQKDNSCFCWNRFYVEQWKNKNVTCVIIIFKF